MLAVRTPLTYYGGKQRLASRIVQSFGPHRIYLEPFAGGAAVLFAKPRAERETLNDLDGTVMRFWRALREHPDELAAAVLATPYSRMEWRAAREDAVDDVEAARRLLVEVDQSFSRGRESWSPPCIGSGRGRWQPGTWGNLPEKLLIAAGRLQGVALECRDAVDLIERWDLPGALLYVDPPYIGDHRLKPRAGYRVEDVGEMWPRLTEALLGLEHAQVVLSSYPCDHTARLEEAGWARQDLLSLRTVQSREGGKLPPAPEAIWVRPAFDSRLFD